MRTLVYTLIERAKPIDQQVLNVCENYPNHYIMPIEFIN